MRGNTIMEDKQARELLAACTTEAEALNWAWRWDVSERIVKKALVYRYGRQARIFAARVLPAIRESGTQFAQMCASMID